MVQNITREGHLLRGGYKGFDSRHWKPSYDSHVQTRVEKVC